MPPIAPSTTSIPAAPATSDSFELGLVLAGAVSAGAYTAGVLDFLLEALDAWEAAKADPALRGTVPSHSLKLRVASGSSAGGMCAAQLAAVSSYACPPVRNPETTTQSDNVLFQSWVNRIDIRPLLDTTDAHAESLLDCSILDQIGAEAFSPQTPAQRRPYLVPGDFTLFTTATNLRGVPYLVQFRAEEHQGHDLCRHGHNWRFVLKEPTQPLPPGTPSHARTLSTDSRTSAEWLILREAALASGAFPVGLRPRRLLQTRGDFASTYGAPDPTWPKPAPDAPDFPPADPYSYWAVDGGTVDNEPLELVRTYLAGGPDRQNPRLPDEVRGITLLIDPFVGWDSGTFADDTHDAAGQPVPLSLLGNFAKTFGAIKNQARFKPEELRLAYDENTYSRFLVSPARRDAAGRLLLSPLAIACGSLGGFGGFLSRRFRAHDYALGRRNAQQFLRRHFALKIEPGRVNPRFGATFEQLQQGGFAFLERRMDGPRSVEEWFMPLVPLVGPAADPVPAPAWPAPYSGTEYDILRGSLLTRADHLVKLVGAEAGFGGFARFGLGTLWKWYLRSKVGDAALEAVKKGLTKHGLG